MFSKLLDSKGDGLVNCSFSTLCGEQLSILAADSVRAGCWTLGGNFELSTMFTVLLLVSSLTTYGHQHVQIPIAVGMNSLLIPRATPHCYKW